MAHAMYHSLDRCNIYGLAMRLEPLLRSNSEPMEDLALLLSVHAGIL